MAEYMGNLIECTPLVYLSTILELHDNPGLPEMWTARFLNKKHVHKVLRHRNRMRLGKLFDHNLVTVGDDGRLGSEHKPCFVLADENVSWLLIEILELVLRRLEKEQVAARALLRWTQTGPDRGLLNHPMLTG